MERVFFLNFLLFTSCLSFDFQWNHTFGDLTLPSSTNSSTDDDDNHNNNNTNNKSVVLMFPSEITVTTSSPALFSDGFLNRTESASSFGTNTLIQWDFFSHMTITSGQCDRIASMVMMLNDAFQRVNPTVDNITSTASRIGNSACVDNICPCKKEIHRRMMISPRRLLEVRTRSSSPDLNPVLRFPYSHSVTSFHKKNAVVVVHHTPQHTR